MCNALFVTGGSFDVISVECIRKSVIPGSGILTKYSTHLFGTYEDLSTGQFWVS